MPIRHNGQWSGHESRLNRDLSHPFGSEGYAREELRAEIASLMLGDQLEIGHDPSQHAAYIDSWIRALESDHRERMQKKLLTILHRLKSSEFRFWKLKSQALKFKGTDRIQEASHDSELNIAKQYTTTSNQENTSCEFYLKMALFFEQ
jgi:hypothetical protein